MILKTKTKIHYFNIMNSLKIIEIRIFKNPDFIGLYKRLYLLLPDKLLIFNFVCK
ncbi:MAG: hypothetical protein HW421_3456 [Ignavibacteria bacterium]|nr:hypothetical protein [Ignavibacteria bacterium]